MKRLFLVLLICLFAGSAMAQSFSIPGFKMKNRFLYSRTTDSLYMVSEDGTDSTLLFYYDGADWRWAGVSVPEADSTEKIDTTYVAFTTYVSNHSVAAVDSVLYSDTAEVAKDLDAVGDADLNGYYLLDVGRVRGVAGDSLWIGNNNTGDKIVLAWGTEMKLYDNLGTHKWTYHGDSLEGESGTGIYGANWYGETVTVPYGGTGAASLTDHAVLLGSGTNSITPLPVLHDGDIIIGVTGSDPSEIHGAFTSPTGTLTHEYGGLEDDVSGYTNGLYGMLSSVTADIDTEAELEAAISDSNIIVESEINSSAEILTLVADPTGTGSLVFSIAPEFTGVATFKYVTVDTTILGDSIIALYKFALPRGNALVVDGNGEIVIDEDADGANFDEGLLKYWNGSDSMFAAAFVCSTHAPSDNDVLVYDATNDRMLWEAQIGASGEANTLVDTGIFNGTEGFGIAGVKQGTVLFTKGLIEGTNIVITTSGDTGVVISGPAGAGEANTLSDSGTYNGTTGYGLAHTKVGVDLRIRGLIEGNNIAMAYSTPDSGVTITAADTVGYASDADPTGTDLAAAFQPLNAVLTDISDGTINTDLVNEQFPWLDNEVSNTLTITGYMQDTDINTFTKLNSWVSDATLLNTDSVAQIDAVWTLSSNFVNTAFPWANDEVDSSANWNRAYDSTTAWEGRGYPAATTALLGIGSFNSDNFAVAAGDVTIKTGGVNSTEILDQTIVGDDIDSTGENFVFDDAYRGTSAESDSAYATEYFAKVKAGDTAAVLRGEFVELDGDTMSGPLRATYFDGIDSVFSPKVITTGAASGTFTMTGATSGSASITVADVAGTPSEIVLPTSDGSSGQQLTTNGSGVTSWATPAYADSAGATDDDMSFDTVWVGVSPPSLAVANFTTTKPGYIFQEPDAHFGDADAGMIRIGAGRIGYDTRDTLYNSDSLDLGGTMCFRQTTEPDGLFEFVFFENSGALRFAIPKSGDSLGTWNSRSMFIAGPARLIDSVVRFDFWGFSKIDANTVATGADLGVQDDLEVMGIGYFDTLDNITAAPIEILADVNMGTNNLVADIIMDTVGAPTFSTLQHLQNIFHSTGWTSGGAFLDSADGAGDVDSLYIAAGTGLIRTSDLATDTNIISFFDWGDTTIAIPADTTLFIGVKYNSGAPVVFDTTADKTLLDHQQNFELGTVTNEGGLLHLTFNPHIVGDHATRMIERTQGTMGIQRDNDIGGVMLGETGTRNPTLTAGILFSKFNSFAISAIDLSVSGSMDRYYRAAGSGFTKEAAVTQWNNTQYDDGDGGLATINNNKYAVQWFYIELDGGLVSMYGRAEYNSLSLAEGESPPSTLPLRLTVNQATLISRIIFQESAASASEIQTIYTTSFPATAAQDHGNLAGLSDDDHTQYLLRSNFSDSVGVTTTPIQRADTIYEDAATHVSFNDDTLEFKDGTTENMALQVYAGASNETVYKNPNGHRMDGGTGPLSTDSLVADRVIADTLTTPRLVVSATVDIADGLINDTSISNTWTEAQDMGGATSLEIPNDADPITNAEGEIAWDSDDDVLEVFSGTESESVIIPIYGSWQALIVDPENFNDSLPIGDVGALQYPGGVEIDSIQITIDADAAYSVQFMTYTDADPPVFDSWIDTLTTGGSDQKANSVTFTDAAIEAGKTVYVGIPATDIGWLKFTVWFHGKDNN